MNPEHLLTCLLLVPLMGTFIIGLSPEKSARAIAIALGIVMVIVTAMIGSHFNAASLGMQLVEKVTWITSPFPVEYHVGIDGLSFCLVALTTIVTLMAILASNTIGDNRPRLYYSMVMLLTTSILGVFISLDLLQFFILWELELIPMYFLIAIWGGPRRDYAAMKFLIYTFLGGIFMLASLLYLYFQTGQVGAMQQPTFDMLQLAQTSPGLPAQVQLLGCIGFMLAFLIKLPSFPLHTWLPDAHVEAPTPISMILAGLLLKMGSYGLVRICMGFFPDFIAQFGVFIMALGAFNVVWAAIACLVQDDMKRIIAYSSVSHMGFVLMGIASLSAAALSGAIFQMVSHGIISALLFFLVGCVYERCHTRKLSEIGGGLAKQMPFLFYFWMLAALANLGLPALSGFVAEATVFYGSFTSPLATLSQHPDFVKGCLIFACTGVILTAGYMLWLLKRLFYGPEQPKWAGHLTDARPMEIFVASVLAIGTIWLGVYPMALTKNYAGIADKMAADTAAHLTKSLGSNPSDSDM